MEYKSKFELEAEQKKQAWLKVEQLAIEACELLLEVNESPRELAQLQWLREKAVIQAKLWNTTRIQ